MEKMLLNYLEAEFDLLGATSIPVPLPATSISPSMEAQPSLLNAPPSSQPAVTTPGEPVAPLGKGTTMVTCVHCKFRFTMRH